MRSERKNIQSFLVILLAFIIIGCAEKQPPAMPTSEMKQVVLDYLRNQPVLIETRYGVKNVTMDERKADVYFVTADVDTNGIVSKRKFIASRVNANGQKSWQLLPATDTNLKSLGITKPDEK